MNTVAELLRETVDEFEKEIKDHVETEDGYFAATLGQKSTKSGSCYRKGRMRKPGSTSWKPRPKFACRGELQSGIDGVEPALGRAWIPGCNPDSWMLGPQASGLLALVGPSQSQCEDRMVWSSGRGGSSPVRNLWPRSGPELRCQAQTKVAEMCVRKFTEKITARYTVSRFAGRATRSVRSGRF